VLVTGRPAHTHRELYRIGADDVVTRELVGEELAVRANNRLAGDEFSIVLSSLAGRRTCPSSSTG
jgi:hypothetical protein